VVCACLHDQWETIRVTCCDITTLGLTKWLGQEILSADCPFAGLPTASLQELRASYSVAYH
jgi:hypothetical protein